MKRILLLILLMLGMSAQAQTYQYKTTEFAIKQINSFGVWSDWSDWKKSDMLITFNYDTDVVKIYSPETQTYRLQECIGNYVDAYGGKQTEFTFFDQDGDKGTLRLRIEANGNLQIYIEFSNIMWVYNIVKLKKY